EMLSWYFGLPHVATTTLLTSFSFLNRKNTRGPAIRAQMRFRGLPEPLVALAAAATRVMDRYLSTRTSEYGWAFYFGKVAMPVVPQPMANVCVRCGQGHRSADLPGNCVMKKLWLPVYTCPQCGATNILLQD